MQKVRSQKLSYLVGINGYKVSMNTSKLLQVPTSFKDHTLTTLGGLQALNNSNVGIHNTLTKLVNIVNHVVISLCKAAKRLREQ